MTFNFVIKYRNLKKNFIIAVALFFFHNFHAQILLNGDFLLGATFWGCSPETNSETFYGGSNPLNSVAEVDAGAGLCQTVAGLTIGKIYSLSFAASRRTGGCPAPATTNVDVTISGGVLAITSTRTNTVFGWSTIGYLFLATSTAHTITFTAGSGFGGSTCGMIIDNISVATSALPVELMKFESLVKTDLIELSWATATEKNNDHFEVERSSDGMKFESISSVSSKASSGNSSVKIDYATADIEPKAGLSYYRLKQVDKDHTASYSKIIAVTSNKPVGNKISVYPNPSHGNFAVDVVSAENKSEAYIKIIGSMGKIVYSQAYRLDKGLNTLRINAGQILSSGNYHCLVQVENNSRNFPVIIE